MTGTTEKTVAASPKAKTSPTKEVSPSKKDSPIKNGTDAATKALNLLAQGKRHLLVNDVNSAVDSLQEACRMLAEQHGETAAECGDAYFYYGRALLDLSRIESGVLGNALDGVPEGDDLNNSQVEDPDSLPVEEKEKVAEQVAEALEDNFKSLMATTKDSKSDEPMEDDKSAKDKSDTAMDTDSAEKEGNDDSQEESQDSQEESQEEGEEDVEEVEGKGEKEDLKEGEKTEEADDLSNLQLAWEMLELSKVIYQRQAKGDKAMALKTAQVFLKLGEVCLENENYPQSIEDFQSCLKLQEANMETDNRCLAETHYQLGVAHSFHDDFDKAIESFTKALKIIQEKVANLEKTKEGSPKEQEHAKTMDDAADAELKDLILLIPEVKEKITDMEEMKKDTKDKINKVKKELGMASAIGGDAKPIDATMIKKRKPENEGGDEPKKTKAVNGN